MCVFAPAIYFSLHEWVCLVSYSARRLFIFGDMNTLNVALRDPKVKRTMGELHMMEHENSTTRDESVKRGRGSVTAVEIRRTS